MIKIFSKGIFYKRTLLEKNLLERNLLKWNLHKRNLLKRNWIFLKGIKSSWRKPNLLERNQISNLFERNWIQISTCAWWNSSKCSLNILVKVSILERQARYKSDLKLHKCYHFIGASAMPPSQSNEEEWKNFEVIILCQIMDCLWILKVQCSQRKS